MGPLAAKAKKLWATAVQEHDRASRPESMLTEGTLEARLSADIASKKAVNSLSLLICDAPTLLNSCVAVAFCEKRGGKIA